jgi:hypothetical protein
MKKKLEVDPKGLVAMSMQEMKKTSGGGLFDVVAHFIMSGTTYFYRMGVREGRVTRSQM